MTHEQIVDKLYSLGIDDGWAVRNGKIVVWVNEVDVPAELLEYVDLDEND